MTKLNRDTPSRLLDIVATDHDEASLLAALPANPAAARLLVAWRRLVLELEAAREAGEPTVTLVRTCSSRRQEAAARVPAAHALHNEETLARSPRANMTCNTYPQAFRVQR